MKNKKRIIIIVIAISLTVTSVLALLEKQQVINIFNNNDENVVEDGNTKINYGPPTREEEEAGERQKDITDQKEEAIKQNASNQSAATVIITDANQYDDIIEVRAFMPNNYQDGICTITFSSKAGTITKKTPAYTDVTTTICTNPLISRSEFPSLGTWQVVVEYSSVSAKGMSASQDLIIH